MMASFICALRFFVFLGLLLAAPGLRAAEWTTLKDCELVKGAYGDGDSFHVHSGSKEMIVRLYFVDTPETEEAFPDRVETQAKYFGLSTKETLQLGEKAAAFTRKTLAKRFTVVTRYEDARGASEEPRYYGFVLLDEGKTNFAEVLVQNGLARVFGASAGRPDGLDVNGEWSQLRRLEVAAKAQKLGGWGGKTVEGSSAAAGKSAVGGGQSNEDFFKKARGVAVATPTPLALPTGVPPMKSGSSTALPGPGAVAAAKGAVAGGGIDLNTAKVAELEALPKIGPVLAAKIVAGRPYATVEELRKVPGIKDATMAVVAPLVRVK